MSHRRRLIRQSILVARKDFTAAGESNLTSANVIAQDGRFEHAPEPSVRLAVVATATSFRKFLASDNAKLFFSLST